MSPLTTHYDIKPTSDRVNKAKAPDKLVHFLYSGTALSKLGSTEDEFLQSLLGLPGFRDKTPWVTG